MDYDEQALDKAKSRFLSADAEIQNLREKIASKKCPLKVGDRVNVFDGKKHYEGIVNCIGPYLEFDEILCPKLGVTTSWAASGYRIKKTTGTLGKKWTFCITSEAQQIDGIWHLFRITVPVY